MNHQVSNTAVVFDSKFQVFHSYLMLMLFSGCFKGNPQVTGKKHEPRTTFTSFLDAFLVLFNDYLKIFDHVQKNNR